MEGLFVVIFVIIGIVNFAAKLQQNQSQSQGGRARQQNQHRQKPDQGQMHIPQQPERTKLDMGRSWGKDFKDKRGYVLSPPLAEKGEGSESEDRQRVGSMNYIEQHQSTEGICNEHPEHRQQKRKEKKPVAVKAEEAEMEDDSMLELTEDNLLRSIVMAEILGPPRAIKRSIR